MTKEFFTYFLIALDFILVSYLVYRILLLVKGTRATSILIGIVFLVLLYFLSQYLNLVTLRWTLGQFFSSLILFFVVIFQEEIRRGLTKFGVNPFLHKTNTKVFSKSVEDITYVATNLSEQRIGALIVLQGEVGLDDFVEDSVLMDALLSRKLLYSLFVKDSALHDGAVLIEGNRIRAAGCVLPLSYDPDLDPGLGTRHRAAVGISEKSDAVVVIVSEENGSISIARDGKIFRNLDGASLREKLSGPAIEKKEVDES